MALILIFGCDKINYMAKTTQKKNSARIPFTVEFDREEDGRWIAEVRELPGVMAYGATRQAALRKVYAIALRTFN